MKKTVGVLEDLLDLVFPAQCVGCGTFLAHGRLVCRTCIAGIPLAQDLTCLRCGARIPNGRKICHYDVPCMFGGAAEYRDPSVRELVQLMKFKYLEQASAPLAALMCAFMIRAHIPVEGWIAVPVPLSQQRLRERGFNQAELLAKHIAKRFAIPLVPDCIIRARETRPQSELKDGNARRANVDGAFKPARALKNERVLLIDDVCTSGATLGAAAQALRECGARSVIALAAADARPTAPVFSSVK